MSDKMMLVLLEGLTSELGNVISEMIGLMPEDAEREKSADFLPSFSSIYANAMSEESKEWMPGRRYNALVPAFDLLDEWELRFSRLADPQDE